ncbi:MAG: HAD-IA family hydrolase, partial [Actinomycetia bacterium]|nr:HAD-IA family hydrolase [Actinomycetes bacterium]
SVVAEDYYEFRYWSDDSFWANERDASEMWGEMYALMLEEMGIDGDRHVIGKAIYDYFGHGDRWRPFPDVEPVFERLKEKGYRLALISNWDSRLAKLCFDMGLDRYLDSVVSSATIGLIKPDPHIFDVALRRMGVDPRRAIHVGDHYYADILGARSAGISPVMIDRFGGGHAVDVPVIEDLYGLLSLIGIDPA